MFQLLIILSFLQAFTLAADEYQERLTRYKFFPLAAAAYSANPSTCLSNVSPNSQLIRRYEVPCDAQGNNCSSYIAVSPNDQAIIVVFRGTYSDRQLQYEVTEIPKGLMNTWGPGGKVSKYFYEAFMSLWNGGMMKDFKAVAKKYPLYQLWVTGHSLGGSMAALGASFIIHNKLFPSDKTLLTTFGEPRTGDCNFAASVNSELKYSYRVVHADDKFALDGSSSTTFCHHKTEVWYPGNMTISSPYTVCSAECNPNPANPSFTDHIIYFEQSFLTYGDQGCIH